MMGLPIVIPLVELKFENGLPAATIFDILCEALGRDVSAAFPGLFTFRRLLCMGVLGLNQLLRLIPQEKKQILLLSPVVNQLEGIFNLS